MRFHQARCNVVHCMQHEVLHDKRCPGVQKWVGRSCNATITQPYMNRARYTLHEERQANGRRKWRKARLGGKQLGKLNIKMRTIRLPARLPAPHLILSHHFPHDFLCLRPCPVELQIEFVTSSGNGSTVQRHRRGHMLA